MIRMKTLTPFLGLVLAGGILLSSCSQDAVFSTIQYDKKLNKNLTVPGSPGKIIELGEALYTGSNAVYQYKKPGEEGKSASWRRLPVQPGGTRIMNIAGTQDDSGNNKWLYALVMQGVQLSDSGLYRKNPDNDQDSWTGIKNDTGYSLQSAWGAGDTLFAGAKDNGENFVLLYVDDSGGGPTLRHVPNASGILYGAAKVGTNYFAAMGKALLMGSDAANLGTPVAGVTSTYLVGLIEISGHLIVVSRDGQIWLIDSSGTVLDSRNFSASLNGALAKWKDPDSGNEADLLLLGRAVPGGSSTATYEYGYRELRITVSGGTPVLGTALQKPGLPGEGAYTSVSNNNSYYNTLGTHPVTGLYQAPWDFVLFASTQKDSLWSCREGDDPKEWNVE
jgi:hypothetical protein